MADEGLIEWAGKQPETHVRLCNRVRHQHWRY